MRVCEQPATLRAGNDRGPKAAKMVELLTAPATVAGVHTTGNQSEDGGNDEEGGEDEEEEEVEEVEEEEGGEEGDAGGGGGEL